MDNLLEQLLNDNLDKIYRFAFNRMHDSTRSEDLAHDIITELICAYPRLKDHTKINAWMWGVAKNDLRTLYVKSEISLDETLATEYYSLYADDFLERLNEETAIHNVRRSLIYLSRRYREILVLYYLENKSYREIAEILQIPMSSVKWRLSESKKVLKEEYEKMDNDMIGGFCFAQNMHVTSSVYNATNDNYLIPRRALKSLLSKNVALCAYETPATITEISEKLSVAAEYVDDVVDELCLLNLMNQTSSRYQVTFPIISEKLDSEVYHFVKSKVQDAAPAIINAAKDAIDSFEKSDVPKDKYQYPYNIVGADENAKLFRMLLSQAYTRTKTIDTWEFPFTEGGYYSVIAYKSTRDYSDSLGYVSYGPPKDDRSDRIYNLTYFTGKDFTTMSYSPDAIKLMGRLVLNEQNDDIPHYEELLAGFVRDGIVMKSKTVYRLVICVEVIPDFFAQGSPAVV